MLPKTTGKAQAKGPYAQLFLSKLAIFSNIPLFLHLVRIWCTYFIWLYAALHI